MKATETERTTWKESTTLIFWGIFVLTVFGLVSSILDSVYPLVNSITRLISRSGDFGALASDGSGKLVALLVAGGRLGVLTRIMQFLTIAGWIVYVIGFSRFKGAQVSDRARWLAGSAYSACWLGLIAMGCSFIGSFLGWFGIVFSLASWILLLISMFKFRGVFNKFTIEETWDETARRGAANLRTSYTFAIILMFFPMICGLILVFGVIGTLGSSLSSFNSSDMLSNLMTYSASALILAILLGLVGVALWLCKTIYLLLGWRRINVGTLAYDEQTDEEGAPADSSEYGYEDYGSKSDNAWLTISLAIIASFILSCASIYYCIYPLTDTDSVYRVTTTGDEEEDDSYDFFGSADEIADENEREVEASPAQDEYISDNQPIEEPVSPGNTSNLSGTINGKYSIEMTITTEDGTDYVGKYWYVKHKKPITLEGEYVGEGRVLLREYVDGVYNGEFEGRLTDKSYMGIWRSADNKTTFPFSVAVK